MAYMLLMRYVIDGLTINRLLTLSAASGFVPEGHGSQNEIGLAAVTRTF
jgi:hypothetical protein